MIADTIRMPCTIVDRLSNKLKISVQVDWKSILRGRLKLGGQVLIILTVLSS
jgi:hypothetical protein